MDYRLQSLYERYLEGETSLAEERELYTLLSSCETLPKEYQAIKAMLEAMRAISQEKCDINIRYSEPKRSTKTTLLLRRIASVAAVVMLIVGALFIGTINSPKPTIEEPMFVCHINGVMVSDQLVAQAEVQRILGGVSKNVNTAKQRIDNLTHLTSN